MEKKVEEKLEGFGRCRAVWVHMGNVNYWISQIGWREWFRRGIFLVVKNDMEKISFDWDGSNLFERWNFSRVSLHGQARGVAHVWDKAYAHFSMRKIHFFYLLHLNSIIALFCCKCSSWLQHSNAIYLSYAYWIKVKTPFIALLCLKNLSWHLHWNMDGDGNHNKLHGYGKASCRFICSN